jgi:hypothetical protein
LGFWKWTDRALGLCRLTLKTLRTLVKLNLITYSSSSSNLLVRALQSRLAPKGVITVRDFSRQLAAPTRHVTHLAVKSVISAGDYSPQLAASSSSCCQHSAIGWKI